jgi:hypothetical protein
MTDSMKQDQQDALHALLESVLTDYVAQVEDIADLDTDDLADNLVRTVAEWRAAAAVAVEKAAPPEFTPAGRRAAPGELCTCGRQAITVYGTATYGEVGHCGISGAAGNPVLPCPWCGSTEPHTESWGGPKKCLDYQIRAPRAER